MGSDRAVPARRATSSATRLRPRDSDAGRRRFPSRLRLLAGALALLVLLVAGPRRVAAESLADDGRAGVVADLQGTALFRPAGRARWGLVAQRTVLRPGDDVRTLARGANAVEIRLAGGGSVVVGPASQARLEGRAALRVVTGEAEVAGTAASPVAVTGPGSFAANVTTATSFRAGETATAALAEPPRWLTGYRASTTDEWMGSLLAKVDGRDVPLAVGYHKVDVTVRDRIAETVVEESFVNTTDRALEGTFSFPLPAGASVSGFGMWVGGELVEADVVERARARRIYEDIRSRRKDPGLLEWSGGNLFQASVFPIPARGEKRIRLRWTETLPREGSLVRWRYALRSDLLRTHPLRELRIHVAAESAEKIVEAGSPTHEVRTVRTDHAVTFDYAASDVRPDRDFEVAWRVRGGDPLRVALHRRGEDGYLLVAIDPPDPSAGASPDAAARDVLPDGAPLDLLLVADTSGSMGPPERAAERRFVEATLALLGPDDRFRLMAFDVAPVWLDDAPLAATPENAARALAFLDGRRSLGWTDVDRAFAAAAAKAAQGTTVVFVGDGIGSAGDPDPVALAKRIASQATPAGATFHAFAPGAAYETGVLDAIASHGGGSVRVGGRDPAADAFALLAETARPALRDVRIAFEGLRTAAVYPERVPDLPAGREQFVLGRFLPPADGGAAGPQRGTVTVTGTLSGKPVTYTAGFEVPAEGAGDSFLPRLWARRHLDTLLARAAEPGVRDEIVAFSERFGIVTPYTSLLVLESDADRAQYGVARRVHMRDGERFFADARAGAAAAAYADEMRRAGAWHTGLRRRMLAEIEAMGRWSSRGAAYGRMFGETSDFAAEDAGGPTTGGGDVAGPSPDDDASGEPESAAPPSEEESAESEGFDDEPKQFAGEDVNLDPTGELAIPEESPRFDVAREGVPSFDVSEHRHVGPGGGRLGEMQPGEDLAGRRWASTSPADAILSDFSWIEPPPPPPEPVPANAWDAETARLLAAVSRRPAEPAAPFEITVSSGDTGPAGPDLWPTATTRLLVAADRWFARERQVGQETRDSWADTERGALAVGRRLGRHRAATEADRGAWRQALPFEPRDFLRSYATWTAQVVSRDGPDVVVRLDEPKPGGGGGNEVPPRTRGTGTTLLVTIDAEKEVVVLVRTLVRGKLVSSETSSGFVRAGGTWWPGTTVWADGEGRETSRRRVAARELPPAEFDAAYRAASAGREDVIFLGAEEVGLVAARRAAAAGRAGFAEHLALACAFAATQRWDETWREWEAARALVPGKPGVAWIDERFLAPSRRGEEWAAHAGRMADALAADRGPDAFALAWDLRGWAYDGTTDEWLARLDVLARAGSVAGSPEETRWRSRRWREERARVLRSAHRYDEAVPILRALRDEQPGRADPVISLADAVGTDDALALFRETDLSTPAWTPPKFANLARSVAGTAWDAARYDAVLEVADAWAARCPDDSDAHACRLAALDALGRLDERERWIVARLDANHGPAEDDAAAIAETRAAIDETLGNGWRESRGGSPLEPRWVDALGALARRLVPAEGGVGALADRILGDWRFSDSPARRRALDGIRADLLAPGGVESGSAERLAQRIGRLAWGSDDTDAATARAVTDRVLARLRATADSDDRAQIRGAALALLDARDEGEAARALLREEISAAAPDRVPDLARALLERLVDLPWSADVEDECWALLPRVAPPDWTPEDRREEIAHAVRSLVDRLAELRTDAGLGPAEDREKLPRAELAARVRAVRADVRRGLAARLATELPAASAELRPWLEIERLSLAAEAGDDLAAVDAGARELLLSPAAHGAAPGDRPSWILRSRAVLVLSYVATRTDAPEGLADRALALLRERLAADPDSLDWRWAIARLLVALDRADETEATLRPWTGPEEADGRWRVLLARLLAERGRFAESIALLEGEDATDGLRDADLRLLARWYVAAGDDAGRERAAQRRWERMDEYRLARRVSEETERVRTPGPDGVPRTMDDEVLAAIREAFRRTSDPSEALGSALDLYAATKDVRLLASLADGIVGHTPSSVYAFASQTGDLLQRVHEEATCDEIRARIAERLPSARTDTDRRGLTLLLVQVERRAAEVLDQPGPHAARALEALRAARKGAWVPGEREECAGFLRALGGVADPALAAEQVAQLRDLHAAAAPGSRERLQLATDLFTTLDEAGDTDAAIKGLGAALDERRAAADGVLPADADGAAGTYADWLDAAGRFAECEAWLVARTAEQTRRVRREAWERRVFATWVAALGHGGTVSLGGGAELFRAARDRMESALAGHLTGDLRKMLGLLLDLHRTAARDAETAEDSGQGGGPAGPRPADPALKAEASASIVRFAHETWPAVLPRLDFRDGRIWDVGKAVAEIAGPAAALEFAVGRLEAEAKAPGPPGRRKAVWESLGSEIAEWRADAVPIGPLDARLLAVVLRAVERHVALGDTTNCGIFEKGWGQRFWAEKAPEFARTARAVADRNPDDAEVRLRAAKYLYEDLDLHADAAGVLEAADARGALRDEGRRQLAQWYVADERWKEALPHVEKLVAAHPRNVDDRAVQVRALHGLGRDADARAAAVAAAATVADLRTREFVWDDAAGLADACLDCGFADLALPLYDGAIAEVRRGSGHLAEWAVGLLCGLARAHAALGHVDEAVDAASRAVVAAAEDEGWREEAEAALHDVVAAVPDLAAWTARWEKAAETTGTDAPVVRRVLARVLLERGDADAAIRHLLVARRVAPDDAAVHADLVAAHEAKGDAAAACDALAESLAQIRRQPDVCVRLADAFRKLGRADDAERALTDLVETAPQDGEGRQRFAAALRDAGRFDEAVAQSRLAVRMRPFDVQMWCDLARSLAAAGHVDDARAALDEFLRTPGGDAGRDAVEECRAALDGR